MIVLMRVRVLVVMAVLVARPGIMAAGMRVAHGPRMAGKPCCSTSTTTLPAHLQ